MFAWHIAWKYLKQGKIKNLLVVIQIIIAIVLLTTIFSLKYSIEKKMNTLITDNRSDVIYLQGKDEKGQHYRDFEQKHYYELRELLGDDVQMALVEKQEIGMITPEDKVNHFIAYEYLGDFFALAFPKIEEKPIKEGVLATKDFFEQLEYNKKQKDEFLKFRSIFVKDVDSKKEFLQLEDGTKLERIHSEILSKELYFDGGVTIEKLEEAIDTQENSVILPYGTGMLKDPHKERAFAFRVKDGVGNYESIHQIVSYFNTQTGGAYQFGITSIRSEYEKKNKEFTTIINVLGFIIAFSLMVVILGFIGNLLLSLERRKKYMATACVCGADKVAIFLSVFFEQSFIIGCGVVLGNLIGLLLQRVVAGYLFFSYHINFYAVVWMNMVALAIALLLELIPILYLRKFDFLEILKKEE